MNNKKYNYIELGDCLTLMKQLPDKYVDVCFTSPPYNDIGGGNEDVSKGKNHHKKYLDVERTDNWFEWQCECIDEMRRVSKKYVLYNVQALKNNRENVYRLIGHYAKYIHDIIIWYKKSGSPTSTPNKISNRYEFLLVIKCDGVKGVSVNSNFYTNVIVGDSNRNNEYSKIHRAVMEQNFCEEVIREFTSKDDIVLDPFSGLGTTALVCIGQNKNYIGFEICKEYYDISVERINKLKNSLFN